MAAVLVTVAVRERDVIAVFLCYSLNAGVRGKNTIAGDLLKIRFCLLE